MVENTKNYVIAASLFPISDTVLSMMPCITRVQQHSHFFEDGFALMLTKPEEFWKERMTEEEFTVFSRSKEFNSIQDSFENLDLESYVFDDEYRNMTLNMIYEEKVNNIKNI